MLKITKENNSIIVEGVDNKKYPDNATLSFPLNSIICETDESDIITFHSASNYDVLFSGNVSEITINGESVNKDNVGEIFGSIANTSGGGGGEGGTTNYNDLSNKPKLNGQTLVGNVTIEETDPIWTAEKVDYYKTVEVDVLVNEAKATASSALSVASSAEGIATAAHSKADEALEELENKADKSDYYDKEEIEGMFAQADATYQPKGDYATKGEVVKKQDTLISGTTIKTINGESILGSGNIEVHGGEGGAVDSVNGKTGVVVLTAEDLGAATTDDLEGKQDKIDDLDAIREGAALGATAIQEHQSLEGYATESWVRDENYATKDEIPSVDGFITETEADSKYQVQGDYITEETDPTVPSHVKAITEEDITKWNQGGGITEETDPTVPQYVKDITEADIEKWKNSGNAITKGDEAPEGNIGIGIFNGNGTEIHIGDPLYTNDLFYFRPLEVGETALVRGGDDAIQFTNSNNPLPNYTNGGNSKKKYIIYNQNMEVAEYIAKGEGGYVRYIGNEGVIDYSVIFTKVSNEKGVYIYDGTETPSKVATEKTLEDYVKNETFNTAVDDLNDRIDEVELYKFPNVTIFGTPSISNGQMGRFSAENYAQFPFLVDFHNQSFEINMCFTTGGNVTSQENILDSANGLAFAVRNGKFVIAMSSDGQTWDMGEHVGSLSVSPNTTYYVKYTWDKTTYKLAVSTDKTTYTDDITVADSRNLYPKQIVIGKGGDGANHFSGTINLNYCDLSIMGQKVWQGMDDAGLATRLATDLSNIDEQGVQKVNEIVALKTINGESIKGDGNIEIKGGGGDYLPLSGGTLTGRVTVGSKDNDSITNAYTHLRKVNDKYVGMAFSVGGDAGASIQHKAYATDFTSARNDAVLSFDYENGLRFGKTASGNVGEGDMKKVLTTDDAYTKAEIDALIGAINAKLVEIIG